MVIDFEVKYIISTDQVLATYVYGKKQKVAYHPKTMATSYDLCVRIRSKDGESRKAMVRGMSLDRRGQVRH